jgi:hypothetical protein
VSARAFANDVGEGQRDAQLKGALVDGAAEDLLDRLDAVAEGVLMDAEPYETAGSSHTPESCGNEEAEVFFVIVGELLFLDESGQIVARENHLTSMERYLSYCREHGIEPRDLTAYS